MPAKPATTIRIGPNLEREANRVFDETGISMSAAIKTFLKAAVREGAMSFEIKNEQLRPKEQPRNAELNHAFLMKKDEFYTQYSDIEQEVLLHSNYFAGKSVICNCDDPFESNFFRFFVKNFEKLKITRLLSTSYAGSPIAGLEYSLKGATGPYKALITEVPSGSIELPDGSLDLEGLFEAPGNVLERLNGDGDFRSSECEALLEQADIVVTNPPFSLFRDYIAQLRRLKKDYLIIGNMNASTYREVFPLFQANLTWYGDSIRSGDRKFYVPDSYPLSAANCGVDEKGRRFIRVKGVRWFTNLDTRSRHTPIPLVRAYAPSEYPKYENYNAIEVSRTQDIPRDYDGIMGVPITFLDRYSPEQFDILMLANGNARTNVEAKVLEEVNYRPHAEDRGGVGIIDGRRSYARILIRRKLP